MEYLPLITSVAILNLFAAVSPGPDFVMVVKNALTHSRKAGIFTGLGVALGLMVHISYCAVGVAIIISKSVVIFNIIKYAGACYLAYMGYNTIRAKASATDTENLNNGSLMLPFEAVKIGFLTNILNPKATMFFLGIFTFVISPQTPIPIVVIISAIMIFTAIVWFLLVSVLFTKKAVKDRFMKFERKINIVFGILLLLIAVWIAVG